MLLSLRKISLAVEAKKVTSSLDLEQVAVLLKIGTVTELSNSNTGYVVTIQSKNNGTLRKEDSPKSEAGVLYELFYGEKAIKINSSERHRVENEFTGIVNVKKDVSI